ncbi:hypothetical protein KHQ07_02705 [Pseudochrobactrum algeriensis]|nr:hypothetical protein KHQ07_02705 [Pseudochrobactrum algeriensis]
MSCARNRNAGDRSASSWHIACYRQGPGIPDAERGSMLKPFVRGAGTVVEGAGMGLAIVSQIMSAHNGSVALSDATGGGLVVSLTFPAG